jgi:uncharacterized protein (TIGR03085 family)
MAAAADVLHRERIALCDSFDQYGPKAPTLCEGWLTEDLAAHLLARETRPDAAIGLVVPGPPARHLQHVMESMKRRGYATLVQKLRSGPPWLHRTGPLAAANVGENWIHHEDIRRANGEAPRPADDEIDEILWTNLRVSALLNRRKLKGAALTLRAPDGRERRISTGGPQAVIVGPPGELTLFMAGRKEAADVTHEGDHVAIAIVLAAQFGI